LRTFFDDANAWATRFGQFDIFVQVNLTIIDGDQNSFARFGDRGEDDLVFASLNFDFFEIASFRDFAHQNNEVVRRAVLCQNDVGGGQRNLANFVIDGLDTAAANLTDTISGIVVLVPSFNSCKGDAQAE